MTARAEQVAYACILTVAGLVCGVRLLLRALDAGTTWPQEARR